MEESMSSRRPKINSNDVEPPKTQEVDLASDIESPEVAIMHGNVDNPINAEYLKWMNFMEEDVVITINHSDNPNAENPVSCGVNGEIKLLERGKPHKVKRKFLDSLIKSTYRVITENYKDKDGVDQTRVKRIPAQVYPISVMDHGPDPELSQRWFMYRCNEAI